jgi:hypothetical protein
MSHLLHLAVLHLHYATAGGSIMACSTLRQRWGGYVSDILSYRQGHVLFYRRHGPGYMTHAQLARLLPQRGLKLKREDTRGRRDNG